MSFSSTTRLILQPLRVVISRKFATTNSHFVPSSEGDKKMGEKPWRDSASLILATADEGNKVQFLVMKRSKGSTFAPNTLCFPGGVLSPADSDKSWIDWFRTVTAAELTNISFLKDSASQPFIYNKKGLSSTSANIDPVGSLKTYWRSKVPPQVALRIAAIRETFEETGVLIVRRNIVEEIGKGLGKDNKEMGIGYTSEPFLIQDPDELEQWQMKVKSDPYQFLALCKHYIIRPDLNALVEWSNWLTPNSFGPRRFDAIFYMAIAPDPVPFLPDPFEVASVRWTTAEKVLDSAEARKAQLGSPQIYELTRLRDTSVHKLKQLMRMRLNLGIERWCPSYYKLKDGKLCTLPGDDLYPPDYRIEQSEESRTLEKTIEESRASSKNLHRLEFKSEYDFQVQVNIGPRLGHVYLK